MATFGLTTVGANAMGFNGGSILGAGYALTEEGTVSKVTLRCRAQSGTANIQCAIYSGNTLKGSSGSVNVGTTAAWVDFNLTSPPTLAAATYYLVFNCSAPIYVWYANSGATGYQDDAVSFNTWPNPASLSSAGTFPCSIYATYEIPVTDSYRQRVILI